MQPVVIEIPGRFWDSQIYRGKLYLFDRSSTVLSLNWDALVSRIAPSEYLRLVMGCAFQRSDYLYGSYLKPFFSDADLLKVFKQKFDSLAQHSFSTDLSNERAIQLVQQDNPFPFPHTDTLIYAKKMYASGDQGVFQTTCDSKRTKYPLSTRPQKQWDRPTTALAAGYGTLALATGEEGLWNIDLFSSDIFFDELRAKRLSKHACDQCQFMYFSIYGSSFHKGGFLAKFTREGDDVGYQSRKLQQIINGNRIFNNDGYSWGARDKIYLMHGRSISVIKYSPHSEDDHLSDMLTVGIQDWKGDFVSAGVSTFGAIVELDNALIVLASDGENYTIPGEPVRWKVFPSSRFYQNHLHVVYEEKLAIYSFNNDYFISQDEKTFGSRALTGEKFADRRINERLVSQIV